MDGKYSNELYNSAVRTNAEAFVGDEVLKGKVGALALKMFSDLEASALMSPYDERELLHRGITFKVACGIRDRHVPAPHMLQLST